MKPRHSLIHYALLCGSATTLRIMNASVSFIIVFLFKARAIMLCQHI